jgi:16S rRNA (guanine(966)-N(2))-methyltransferase RsmD
MAKKNQKQPQKTGKEPPADADSIAGMRIVGGTFRGRKLQYSGDIRTRPMKDRLREAIFNLVGPSIRGTHAIDLFAGTGALALEALSRGAARATLIEQHHPTAKIIRQNIATLAVEDRAVVQPGNTFIWWKMEMKQGTLSQEQPWAVFCSPPYEFFVSRLPEMLELIEGILVAAPIGSLAVVEADQRFDFGKLPHPQEWDVREYLPAVVGIYRKA